MCNQLNLFKRDNGKILRVLREFSCGKFSRPFMNFFLLKFLLSILIGWWMQIHQERIFSALHRKVLTIFRMNAWIYATRKGSKQLRISNFHGNQANTARMTDILKSRLPLKEIKFTVSMMTECYEKLNRFRRGAW